MIQPEVAGGIGKSSIIDYENARIKTINHLEYCFDGWLGGEIVSSYPCFIVTESLKNDIVNGNLKGVHFRKALVTCSDEFLDMFGDFSLPTFEELICEKLFEERKADEAVDFYIDCHQNLIVSEEALSVLKKHNISSSTIIEI